MEPTEDELDVLDDLGRLYRANQTRMACQVFLSEKMEGSLVEIPRSAFAFFEKFNDGDD